MTKIPIDLSPFLEQINSGASIADLKPELFSQLCFKNHYLDECEPGYCIFRITETCPYIHALRKLKDATT